MSYAAVGMGALEVPPALAGMVLDTDAESGLRAVSYQTQPLVVAALQLGSFQEKGGDIDPLMGLAVGGTPTPWVDTFVANGNMVMIRTEALSGGLVEVAVTKDPFVVADMATATGGFAMLKGPAAIAVTAKAIIVAAKQGKPPPVVEPPPPPAPPGTPPAPAQAAAGVPGWAIGLGLFGIGTIAVMALIRRRP